MEKKTATIVLGLVALAGAAGIVIVVFLSKGQQQLTQMAIIAITALANLSLTCAGAIGGLITGEYIDKRNEIEASPPAPAPRIDEQPRPMSTAAPPRTLS